MLVLLNPWSFRVLSVLSVSSLMSPPEEATDSAGETRPFSDGVTEAAREVGRNLGGAIALALFAGKPDL